MNFVHAYNTIRNITLYTVNVTKYFPFPSGTSLTYCLYDIRLAIEAISVPRPPILTPSARFFILCVNPDSRSAAGTLLIHWLVMIPTPISLPSAIPDKNNATGSILPILPVNMKKPTNVNNNA